MTDRITDMAREALRNGTAGSRPLYKAARQVAAEEEEARRRVLASRQPDNDSPLDSELFPPGVFNPDGTRKRYKPTASYPDGQPRLTQAEERANFEWDDSRM